MQILVIWKKSCNYFLNPKNKKQKMSKVNIQSAIAEYHQMMTAMGMDMHSFHADWHGNNPDPHRPPAPNPSWGINNKFGNDFLLMHHEMIKSKDNEQKFIMHHQSLVSWFQSKHYDLPSEWNPLTAIPSELAFNTQDPSLKRRTNNPQFELPKYFTVQGIGPGEKPEPITRAIKLADFKNLNQLGCCIVYPHNSWHVAIGGAMLAFDTAIDDPVFYFGVHWHIDKVFDAYKNLHVVFNVLEKAKAMDAPENFTDEEMGKLKTAEELGLRIRSKDVV